ncbi:hypothetical protein [Pseudoalteromonas sp. bablab_jr010]|uniref:hypothetical protein n=1 Tax=Pseudoalteromonas sp. bablab_jr010 TaxID=2755063 RepID=UPI0018F30029|nr:hypothetical protein [Pseudoalteromonas sp. bablab_jr010]
MNHHSSGHSESETVASKIRYVSNSRLRKLAGELTESPVEKYIALAFLERLIWEHKDKSIKLAALEHWVKLIRDKQ